jgi:hypothetical protein
MVDSAWRACHVEHFEHLPFLFFLSPLNQEKFMEKKKGKKENMFMIEKIHITFF